MIKPTAVFLISILLSFPIFGFAKESKSETLNRIFSPEHEITERRTMNSKHYYNEDGTFTCRIWTAPVHYHDETGGYRNIDRTIVPYGPGNEYAYTCETNNLKSYFPEQYDPSSWVTVKAGTKSWIRWRSKEIRIVKKDGTWGKISSPLQSSAYVSKDIISYDHTFPFVDEEYIIRPNGLKHNIILLALPDNIPEISDYGYLEFIFRVEYSDNLHPSYLSNCAIKPNPTMPIRLITDNEKYELRISQPVIYEMSRKNIMTIGEIGLYGNELHVKIPYNWLKSPKRSYPIVIDPSISIYPSSLTGWCFYLFGWKGPWLGDGTLAAGPDNCGYSPFGTGGVPAGSSISSMIWRLVNNNTNGAALNASVTRINSETPDCADCLDEVYISGLPIALNIYDENFLNLSETAAVNDFEDAINGSGTWYGLGIRHSSGSGERFFFGTWDFDGIDSRLDINYSPTSIELTSLTATPDYGRIFIRWNVASEENCIEWRIHRSNCSNGTYEIIARIPGRGNAPDPKDYLYIDKDVVTDGTFYYKLSSLDNEGKTVFYGAVRASPLRVPMVTLQSCKPNPFKEKVEISYVLGKSSKVHMQVFNPSGRLVKTLVERHQSPGRYSTVWDGKDNSGNPTNSGLYFLRIIVDDCITEIKKVVLLK
jgi:hypothetical protein